MYLTFNGLNICCHLIYSTICIHADSHLFVDIYGYHGNKMQPFLKITVAYPKLIAPARRLLEGGLSVPPYPHRGYQTYESNIDFEIRYKGDYPPRTMDWTDSMNELK